MENSYRFFENRQCKYFPCHQGLSDFNCLFCYCPLYFMETCPGTPQYLNQGQKQIKSCSGCSFPHQPKSYDAILCILQG